MNDAFGELRRAQRSVVVFGVYLLALALVLLAVPNVLLAIFGIPSTQEVWIRVVGMLVGFLGYYYVRHGASAVRSFLEMTIHVRLSVPVFFFAFVVFAGAPWQLMLFAVLDILGAGWTWWSLQGSLRPLAAPSEV
jgi:hypothetical protein